MCDNNLDKIQNCLNHVLQKKGFQDINVEIEGQTGKGDGYSGEIFFVKVTATSKISTETLHLAVKCSIDMDSDKKENAGLGHIYAKEIHLYENVKSAYLDFLKERNLSSDILNFMPLCYGSRRDKNEEFLVFENLKPQGFDLWDKASPMSDDHVQLVLECYGKWHALSMALKTQKPNVYKKLIENNVNVLSDFTIKSQFYSVSFKEFKNALSAVKFENEKISKALELFSEDDFKYAFGDMYFQDPDYSVILHGDCWNNNFMFKSPNGGNSLEVKILDWQCSGLGSPVFDVSYFIYACANNGKHRNVKPLLEIYYKSFSQFLQQLGGSPEKSFSFEKLLEHWKRFSHFGFFLSILVIKVCTLKSNDKPSVQETVDKGGDIMDVFTFAPSTEPHFIERCKENFLHYFKNAIE